jgi:hypothetical protein
MEWIKCTEKLPEELKGSIYSKMVLAFSQKTQSLNLATFINVANVWCKYEEAPRGRIKHISHWLTLPYLPEEI